MRAALDQLQSCWVPLVAVMTWVFSRWEDAGFCIDSKQTKTCGNCHPRGLLAFFGGLHPSEEPLKLLHCFVVCVGW